MRHARFPVLFAAILFLISGCNSGAKKTTVPNAKIIFRDASGRTLTEDDILGATGTFNYEIAGSTTVPQAAERLHQQARQAGSAGDYPRALDLLAQASALAPDWSYPTYDAAYTYLLMDNAENALKNYQKVAELNPRGFFTALTAADTLSREKSGDLRAGTYKAYLTLEWTTDEKEKAKILNLIVEKSPNFAPAWKELALLVPDKQEALDLIEKGLAANPDPETKGILLINKAAKLNDMGNRDEAMQILGTLALDPNATIQAEHLAKFTMRVITVSED